MFQFKMKRLTLREGEREMVYKSFIFCIVLWNSVYIT